MQYYLLVVAKFQSTLPVRGATDCHQDTQVSGHEFQSTLPVRGATMVMLHDGVISAFQSTLPVRGATLTQFLPINL